MPMIPMPAVAELVAHAIVFTDFVGEVSATNTVRETYRAATIATNLAAESWEERNGHPVGATVDDSTRNATALALVAYADALNSRIEQDGAANLAFSVQCGDLTIDGRAIPYDRYLSAA